MFCFSKLKKKPFAKRRPNYVIITPLINIFSETDCKRFVVLIYIKYTLISLFSLLTQIMKKFTDKSSSVKSVSLFESTEKTK